MVNWSSEHLRLEEVDAIQVGYVHPPKMKSIEM